MKISILSSIALSVSVAFLAAAESAHALTLAKDGKAAATIVLAKDAVLAERTAATELATYLKAISGAEFAVADEADATATGPCLFVGPTAVARQAIADFDKLGPEEWQVRTSGGNLLLAGGRPRGTLYAVYHFLEDALGVHWWNPWEETVPQKPALEVGALDLHGKPTFRYRDIYMLYGNDKGRFAARNRLNRDGDARIAGEYGGCMDYGPPYHVHTFYMYLPPKEYFDTHPEYYSLINGKRTADNAQLCLTNPEVRQLIIEKLRNYIVTTRAEAEKTGSPPPLVFSISQNDWYNPCQCERCHSVLVAEGSEVGLLIQFLNAVSDAITAEYPDVCLDTLAYQYTQQPPRTMRPRDSVIFRLCDTESDLGKPVTAPQNRAFHDTLLTWAGVAKNLRIWDYAVTYAQPYGMPFPSAQTYAADYRFYAEHNVEGVFTELEFPILADTRDLKVWMMMKLLENPYQDDAQLLQTFTDGFYGPAAGPMVREYLAKLQAAVERKGAIINWTLSPSSLSYIGFDFAADAHGLFDRAEQAVASDPVLLRRVRHARLPLDRATVLTFRRICRDWIAKGNDPAALPLKPAEIAKRCGETWQTQIELRIPEKQRAAEKASLDAELLKYAALPAITQLPEKFRGLPPAKVFDFTADLTRNWNDIVKLAKDPDAESGITNRLEFPTAVESDRHPLDKYKLPMPWGLYGQATKTFVSSADIKPEDVPGPGYHWYRYAKGPAKIAPSYYLYFFWSWIIQLDIDAVVDTQAPDVTYDIWANIKFEGPAFPHGKPEQKNAICVERVVLVRSDATAPAAP
ncbi:MAG: hypothetical protein A3K19_22520 [Lentisphaerae bacterium RIFOXYB12_FULL_65_16]|nr:MAG: hypothetical protein A3K18_17495 [Lentisphaerae bacterium RIFOXYA12_64_32]OGV92896.1 MAG: hypothetical protein A3K19_22520 [Lentisphaerae bacterium RIFOXYB12_FULL_65_16]